MFYHSMFYLLCNQPRPSSSAEALPRFVNWVMIGVRRRLSFPTIDHFHFRTFKLSHFFENIIFTDFSLGQRKLARLTNDWGVL